MQSYQDAARYLGVKTDRPLPGRATRIIRRDDHTIAVRYHATDVVTYQQGSVRLDSGGFRTLTTKARIAEYAPIAIWQTRGLWYVAAPRTAAERGEDQIARASLYQDGITIRGRRVFGAAKRSEGEAAKRLLDQQVSRYIKGFCAAALAAGRIDPPGSGDCWGCLFRADGQSPTTEVLGFGHYLDHFGGTVDESEPYYVPSLLQRAIMTAGYREPAVIWHLINADLPKGRVDMLRGVLTGFFRRITPALLKEKGPK